MTQVELDLDAFKRRWESIHLTKGLDAIMIGLGQPTELTVYQKSTALCIWLLGYEFPETIFSIWKSDETDSNASTNINQKTKFTILTSVKKASILDPLVKAFPNIVTVIARPKDIGKANEQLERFYRTSLGTAKTIAVLPKDQVEGPLINEWMSFWNSKSNNHTIDDASYFIAKLTSIKDMEEHELIKSACQATTLIHQWVIKKIIQMIDERKKITHSKITLEIENYIQNDLKLPSSLDHSLIDLCYPPVIQSSSPYNLKPSALSDDNKLRDKGVIVLSLGVRYRSYCANVGRNLLVAPSESLKSKYQLLIKVQKETIDSIKPGITTFKSLYEFCKDKIKEKEEEEGRKRKRIENDDDDSENENDSPSSLLDSFPNNIGFAMGIEYREPEFIINSKNEEIIQKGMCLNLIMGFSDTGLFLADTLFILGGNGEGKVQILTSSVPYQLDKISFTVQKEKEEKKGERGNAISIDESSSSMVGAANIITTRVTRQRVQQKASIEEEKRRREHQQILGKEQLKEALEKCKKNLKGKKGSKGGEGDELDDDSDEENESSSRPYYCYHGMGTISSSSSSKSPSIDLFNHHKREVLIDVMNDTIICPINGFWVPFHIIYIKNVNRTEEAEGINFIRINFNVPTMVALETFKDPIFPASALKNPNVSFIKMLTFKMADAERAQRTIKQIQEMKRSFTEKEQAKRDMADLVIQANLIELSGSGNSNRIHRLQDIFIRPNLEQRRTSGQVEIHSNGLRYISNQMKQQQQSHLDVIFANIRDMFFQSCDHESVVLIHLSLKTPVMVGKKKTLEIQFYREALDSLVDETSGRRKKMRYGDEDEIAEEQEEGRRKQEANQEFKRFADKIREISHNLVKVEVPIRELGFQGIYAKQSMFFQPTTYCLVQLTETPPLVLHLSDVEVAFLERVMFGLKNFDLVFIFKDHKSPVCAINSIPMTSLEAIKSWLDSVDIYFVELKVNLNWTNVLKTIVEDPLGFYEMGGWTSLQLDKGMNSKGMKEGSSEDSDASPESSEYNPEESEEDEEDEEDDGDSGENSEEEYQASEDDSYSDGTENSEESEIEEEEESAPDWDELEKQASKKDTLKKKNQQRK